MIKKIINKLKSKDAKLLIENFVSLSVLQIFGMFLPLITLPYVLRVLGFEKYGIIILATSLVAYFQSITDFSFRITATRDVAVFRESQNKLNFIYSKVITVKVIFLFLSTLFLILIILLYPPFYKEKTLFFLTIPILFGYALFPEWFFQGIEKMKYITILNLSIKVFFTICVFVFIKSKEDYWLYPLLQSAGFIGAGFAGQLILIKKYKLKFIWLPKKIIKKTIIGNFPIFVNQFFPTLYNNTSSFLLGIFGGTFLLGIYDAIKKIVDLSIVLLDIVSRVFFPFLNRKKDAFLKYKKLMLFLSFFMSLGILLVHQLIFWYLNITYPGAFYILLILMISVVGYSLYDIFGLNYFIIKRHDRFVMKNTITASLIGFLTAFPLIYYFGILGASLNLCFARWMMGGRLYIKYLQLLNYENSHTP